MYMNPRVTRAVERLARALSHYHDNVPQKRDLLDFIQKNKFDLKTLLRRFPIPAENADLHAAIERYFGYIKRSYCGSQHKKAHPNPEMLTDYEKAVMNAIQHNASVSEMTAALGLSGKRELINSISNDKLKSIIVSM